MNPTLVAASVFLCLLATVLIGMHFRKRLPKHHLDKDTRDAVTLAMGLIGTMSALLLGLLVSSAKGSYDTNRNEVIQIAAKVAYLDRLLTFYGPDAKEVRVLFRSSVDEGIKNIWNEDQNVQGNSFPSVKNGHALYEALLHLTPRDDAQSTLKNQAVSLATELGQLLTLLGAQSVPSVSKPMLAVVISWLIIIFFSFTLFAPPNATAHFALLASVFSVSGAIFLILELDHPFTGLIKISSEPMLEVLRHLAM